MLVRIAIAFPAAVLVLLSAAAVPNALGDKLPNAGGIVGPERCGECHKREFAAWKDSGHARGYHTMHRSPAAKAIAANLGMTRIKSAPSCIRCHYTPVERLGAVRAGQGVSCESCHGPAADWLAVHDDFGGSDVNEDDEKPEHRVRRIERCRELGMRHPEVFYELASRCYGCHAVDDEELVDIGGHPSGVGFELLSWNPEAGRHAFSAADGMPEVEPSSETSALLYLLGPLLDLEHGLTAAARAKGDGVYLDSIKTRVGAAVERIEEISRALGGDPTLDEILVLAGSVSWEANTETELAAVAARIRDRTQRFLEGRTGTGFADLAARAPAAK